MNQINPKPNYTGPKVEPQEPIPNRAGASRAQLTSDKASIDPQDADRKTPATRRDLVELHRRVVSMFTKLNEGLSETALRKASEDRALLGARIDEMERAVNRIEAMMRIELLPEMRAMLNEELRRHVRPRRKLVGPVLLSLVMTSAAMIGGAYFAPEIMSVIEMLSVKFL